MEQKKMTGYPSIDKPWLKYYSEEAIHAELPECTIYEYLYQNNKDHLQDTALIYFDKRISYEKLFVQVDRVEEALRAVGVGKGQVVTINLPSIPETVYLLYALSKIGAIANMIDPRSDEEMLKHYLEEAESKVFVFIEQSLPVVNKVIQKTRVETAVCVSATESLPFKKGTQRKARAAGTAISWRRFLASACDFRVEADTNEVCGQTPVLMTHTSGTTGLPKGVVLSNKNVNAVAHQYEVAIMPQRGERYLCLIPPFIAFGICTAIHMPICLGVASVLIPMFKPPMFFGLLRKYKPEHFVCAPLNYEALITDKRNINLSFLRSPGAGGDYMECGYEKEINAYLQSHRSNVSVLKGYGMTEVSSSACSCWCNCNELGSVGVPLVDMVISVFAVGTTTELTYGQEGELCFTGPNVMQGYYKNPEATAAALKLHADGQIWMHSGDIGYMTEDGHVYVIDRLKRAITVDGQIILPAKTERVLLAHPYVEKCAVVGNERSQFVAHVVLAASVDETEVREQLVQVCNEKLPENARPINCIFCKALPLTPVGKVDYRALEQSETNKMEVIKNMAQPRINVHAFSAAMLNQPMIPYYINDDRLLDLCAVENDGYVEYVDISQTRSNQTNSKKEGNLDLKVHIVKLIGLGAHGEISREDSENKTEERKSREIQTSASMLSYYLKCGKVANIVQNEGNTNVKEGDLVCLPGRLVKLNRSHVERSSIKFRLGKWDLTWLFAGTKLYDRLNGIPDRAPIQFSTNIELNTANGNDKHVNFAGMLSRKYLYQCEIDDLWGIEMKCLCKILSLEEDKERIEIIALFV